MSLLITRLFFHIITSRFARAGASSSIYKCTYNFHFRDGSINCHVMVMFMSTRHKNGNFTLMHSAKKGVGNRKYIERI